ncbi:hypothetical protein S83_023959, partial [Arachis hypogaea]
TDLRSKVAFISLFYLWRIRKLLAGHPPSLLSLLTALFPLFAASILFSGAILLYAATPCSPLRSRLLCRPPPRPLLRALHRCLSSARKKPSSAVDSVAAAAVGCPSSSSTSENLKLFVGSYNPTYHFITPFLPSPCRHFAKQSPHSITPVTHKSYHPFPPQSLTSYSSSSTITTSKPVMLLP